MRKKGRLTGSKHLTLVFVGIVTISRSLRARQTNHDGDNLQRRYMFLITLSMNVIVSYESASAGNADALLKRCRWHRPQARGGSRGPTEPNFGTCGSYSPFLRLYWNACSKDQRGRNRWWFTVRVAARISRRPWRRCRRSLSLPGVRSAMSIGATCRRRCSSAGSRT
jgi:hypothetical protein